MASKRANVRIIGKLKAVSMPHSWAIADWPDFVHPKSPSKGKYLVREHRDELQSLGALTRIGRELVILGEGYARFLARNIERVEGYASPFTKDRAPQNGETPEAERTRDAGP